MKNTILIFFILLIATKINAQVIQSIDAIKGSINDAEKLTRAYVTPLERGFGSIGSNGWVNFSNSTKNKLFTFDVGVQFTMAITPEIDRTYDVNDLNLEELKASDPNQTVAQTVSGSSESIWLETKDTYRTPAAGWPPYKESPVYKFKTAEGTGYPLSALPMLTLGVKTFGTQLTLRGLPQITLSDVNSKIYSYGAGIQLNAFEFLNKFFSNLKKPLGIEVSILAAYQETRVDYNPDVKPDTAQIGISLGDNGPYDNQDFMLKTKSIPIQAVFSKQWKVFTFYGGLGYNFTSSEVALTGNYPVYSNDPSNSFQVIVDDITDPFAYSQTHDEFRVDLGMVFQYGIIKMRTNYTFAKYDVFNLSIDLSF